MHQKNRREFLKDLSLMAGSAFLLPVMTAQGASSVSDSGRLSCEEVIPIRPCYWDPIAYNRTRGNAGAIPKSYLPAINGFDGAVNHIGKHLPYIPDIDPALLPEGYVPIMWGNPYAGYKMHPNAEPDASNNKEGHWYNWIRIRKATRWWAKTAESTYSGWPMIKPSDTGSYAVSGSGKITDQKGINTVYLAKLPSDVSPGDTVRIWAHCLTHGEYVDFVQIPEKEGQK